MKFKLQNGKMALEIGSSVIHNTKIVAPISTSLIVDIPNIKESIKIRSKNFLKNSNLAIMPLPVLGIVDTASNIDSGGVFWNTFLTYIFPWMLDIGKVYCLIRIAQAFYQEKRGGRDSGTGWSALLEHGKWYLILWLLPIGVELIDEVGHKMFVDMHNKQLMPTTTTH